MKSKFPQMRCAICLLWIGYGYNSIERLTGINRKLILSARIKLRIPISARSAKRDFNRLNYDEIADRAQREAWKSEWNAVMKFDERNHWITHKEANRQAENKKARKTWRNNKHDPEFKLARYSRRHIWGYLKSHDLPPNKRRRPKSRFRELLGCDVQTLKLHIQSQFKRGMNWNNQGKWHIDHIIPLSSWNLMDPKQQAMAFNYKNLQPLWKRENRMKSDAMPPNPQIALL